jgi:hypothetical protein
MKAKQRAGAVAGAAATAAVRCAVEERAARAATSRGRRGSVVGMALVSGLTGPGGLFRGHWATHIYFESFLPDSFPLCLLCNSLTTDRQSEAIGILLA